MQRKAGLHIIPLRNKIRYAEQCRKFYIKGQLTYCLEGYFWKRLAPHHRLSTHYIIFFYLGGGGI